MDVDQVKCEINLQLLVRAMHFIVCPNIDKAWICTQPIIATIATIATIAIIAIFQRKPILRYA